MMYLHLCQDSIEVGSSSQRVEEVVEQDLISLTTLIRAILLPYQTVQKKPSTLSMRSHMALQIWKGVTSTMEQRTNTKASWVNANRKTRVARRQLNFGKYFLRFFVWFSLTHFVVTVVAAVFVRLVRTRAAIAANGSAKIRSKSRMDQRMKSNLSLPKMTSKVR